MTMKSTQIVEAALFSAGRAVSVEEICEETGLKRPAVRQAIDELRKVYDERETVLEISKAGAKWAMQVRTIAAEPATKFAPMEIAPKLLKTLALIAYHQPMKQSELVDMIGSKVYDHIPELKERGLVRTRKEGVTKILSTTDAFPEYFGLDAANHDEIRAVMAKMVGLPPPEKKKREKDLASFPEVAAKTVTEAPSESAGDDPPTEVAAAEEERSTA